MRGLLSIALATVLLGVCNSPEARPDRAPAGPTHTRSLTWEDSAVGPQRAIVLLPREHVEGARWPLLVALHGQGEARRGVRRGAWGWVRDYELATADVALRRGRLTSEDFLGFVEPDRLRS